MNIAPGSRSADAFARATALHQSGKLAEAERLYRAALATEPNHARAHYGLGVALIGLGRLPLAAAHFRTALALAPTYADAAHNLGCIEFLLNRPEAALAWFDATLAIAPDHAGAHYNRGGALMEIGRIGEARASVERALALTPERASYYRCLGELKRFTADDPHLAAMERLAAKVESLAVDDQIELHFALGKALEDVGRPDRAFDHLLRGNALKRRQVAYDERATLGEIDRIRAAFTAPRLRDGQGGGAASERPVFVVGMPRSGSTLVEQILAGHPQVFAAGELEDFPDAMGRLGGLGAPESAAAITPEQARRLGARYLETTTALAPAAARIVDKLPSNFRLIGLIRLALPGARIIHTRRDPLDTCVSCFASVFTGHQPFTYDLGELGRYYRAYQRLMAHWRQALPDGALLEIDYEEVVADLEGQAKRLLGFCGLPWDPACLAFHQAKRPVRTRSRVQVRQPLYASSVGRWRVYGDRLGPLRDGLGGN